jgi:hypothetical protein
MVGRKNSRNDRLVQFYAYGNSMRETATKFKLSLERVRQLLRREAPHLIRRIGDTRSNSTGLSAIERATQ